MQNRRIGALVGTAAAAALALAGLGVATPAMASGHYFASCHDAYVAGYGDMQKGTDGYRSGLDGDKDGIACEWNKAGADRKYKGTARADESSDDKADESSKPSSKPTATKTTSESKSDRGVQAKTGDFE